MEIGFTGTLFLVFLVLKLVGVIAWSWWWVFSPLIVSGVIALIFLIGFTITVFKSVKKASKHPPSFSSRLNKTPMDRLEAQLRKMETFDKDGRFNK